MTRINAGILPTELCDQHLVAEYRELPRMRAMAIDRLSRFLGPGPRPDLPTLGAGHMAYFLPFGWWLRDRWLALCAEMRHRRFTVNLEWRDYPEALAGWMPERHEELARPLLIDRIALRLRGMPRAAWTARSRPEWAEA